MRGIRRTGRVCRYHPFRRNRGRYPMAQGSWGWPREYDGVDVLAAGDLTAHKWAFDVSESLVSAIAGGFILAIAAKRLGFSAFSKVAWGDLVTFGLLLVVVTIAAWGGVEIWRAGQAGVSDLFTAVIVAALGVGAI